MHEIREKRRLHSKTFDLGNGQHRVDVGRTPLHYEKDGELVDLDLSPRHDRGHWLVDQCPFSLRISDTEPSYLYTSRTGKYVEITLPGSTGAPVRDESLFVWQLGDGASYTLQPTSKGCLALLHLLDGNAPRIWQWRVTGDRQLLAPITGTDAKGQRLELLMSWEGDVLRVEWTGRATSPQYLRSKKKSDSVWTDDIAYPVCIDPTVNENVAAGSDDASSGWSNDGANFVQFASNGTALAAGQFYHTATYAGIRFQTISIPSGSTISSATLTVRVIAKSGSPNVNIYGNDIDDASTWSSPGNRIKSITKTTSVTNISSITSGADNNFDVTSIVGEIIARAGWASNNDIAFGLFNNHAFSGINRFLFAALEHTTLTEARLSITYTSGTPVSGAGSASGTATATAVSQSIFKVSGSASGAATATAVGQATIPGEAAASATGVSGATAVSRSIFSVPASASGAATAVASSQVIASVNASATGVSSATAVGASITAVPAAASASGAAAATAVASIIQTAVASASGVSGATAVGSFILVPKPGTLGAGGGIPLYVDPEILRRRTKIKHRKQPNTHVIKIGDWPEELLNPPKPKKSKPEDLSKYVDRVIDAADNENDDEEVWKIIKEALHDI